MASAIDWKLLDHTAAAPVVVGDMISADAGGMPIYRVVVVADGQVWLDDERHTAVQVMPLDRFRWRGGPAMARAAA